MIDLADPSFDPAAFVQELHDKVDAVHSVIGRMETVAGWLKAVAKPLTSKASALMNNRERLRDYVTHALLTERACRLELGESLHGVSLPGNMFKVRLRESPPALQIDRPATAEDYERFPNFVSMIRSYSWNSEKIKHSLQDKTLPDGIPAHLTVGHWPEFVANVPEKLESKRKKKT